MEAHMSLGLFLWFSWSWSLDNVCTPLCHQLWVSREISPGTLSEVSLKSLMNSGHATTEAWWNSLRGSPGSSCIQRSLLEQRTGLFSTFQEVKANGANYMARMQEPSFPPLILWSPMVYEFLVKLMFACLECQRDRHYRPIRDKNQTNQSCPFKN